MKNKKILYILTILLTLFSFNKTANAAQELTCVYHDDGGYKVALIQNEFGEHFIYLHNDKNAGINSAGWHELDYQLYDITINEKLNECPNYINFKFETTTSEADGNKRGVVGFYDSKKSGYKGIDDSQKYNYVTNIQLVGKTMQTNDLFLNNYTDESNINNKYIGTCLYQRKLSDGSKHNIQIDFSTTNFLITEYDPQKEGYSNEINKQINDVKAGKKSANYKKFSFIVDKEYDLANFLNNREGDCPVAIRVDRKYNYTAKTKRGATTRKLDINTTIDGTSGDTYFLQNVRGENPITGKALTMDGMEAPIIITNANVENCTELLGEDIARYFSLIWTIIKIAIPIILIGFGTIDFVQAIFAGKEDGMKKAQGKFMKRIIIAIIIFIIPFVLELLLDMANNVWDLGTDLCGIIF